MPLCSCDLFPASVHPCTRAPPASISEQAKKWEAVSVWKRKGLSGVWNFLKDLASLVTDRHTQVQKFVREQKPDIAHFYDVWHLCKALTKKLDAISKKKDCNKIKMWQKSIKNHLYWSASGSSSGEETVAKWTSLLNHIQNVHVHENPLFPKCLHPPSDKNKKQVYNLLF